MVKIFLTSDIHLGHAKESSPVPEKARIKTFKRIMQLAKSHDLFLIAGDLFHNKYVSKDIVDLVKAEFNALRKSGVEIIYILGDHESGNDADISFLSDLNATEIISSNEMITQYKYSKDGQEVTIYGVPAFSKVSISEIKRDSDTGFHIGLFHVEFYSSETGQIQNITRINKKDMVSSNLDFYALGHNHNFKLFKSNARYIGAYPGSPESVTFNEKGDRYALSLIIKDDEIYQIKRLTVNSCRLEHLIINCSDYDALSVAQAIEEKLTDNGIMKIILTGERNFKIDINQFKNSKADFQRIYLDDRSSPDINLFFNEYLGEESLRGEFFSLLYKKIQNNECPEIDINILSDILDKVINSGACTMEDLCSYLNA